MILKALYDYYNRATDLAPAGMEFKEIGFILVLDQDGKLLRIEDRHIDKKRSQQFLVAKHVNRTSGQIANILWDNSSYVLGLSDDDIRLDKYREKLANGIELSPKENDDYNFAIPKAIAKNEKCFNCFRKKVADLLAISPENKSLQAINLFYSKPIEEIRNLIKTNQSWDIIKNDITSQFSFLIQGDLNIVAENKDIIFSLTDSDNDKSDSKANVTCLITGEKCAPVSITTATPIVGSQATARLVAFQVNSGYDSYGKSKGLNAPISKDAEFAYTSALSRLLDKDSQNKFLIGNRTYLFWSSSKSEASIQLEQGLFSLFGKSFIDESKSSDDPNSKIKEVKDVFMKIYSGSYPTDSNDHFYILGIAPNSARLAIVYWQELSVKDFAKNLLSHFEDMDLIDTRLAEFRKPFAGLHTMMSAVTISGKSSDVQPNLPDAVIKSIMQHTPYPITLYNASLRRIRTEHSPSIVRVAILKAYLNRIPTNNNKKITAMLDKENINPGYLCGRLFAVLEFIQARANGKSNIRERYMNSASATPSAVFSTLLNLSVHHLEKLDNGTTVYFEKLKGEIVENITADGFPKNLDLNDQGRFFIGYYHQRQALFSKNESSDNEE